VLTVCDKMMELLNQLADIIVRGTRSPEGVMMEQLAAQPQVFSSPEHKVRNYSPSIDFYSYTVKNKLSTGKLYYNSFLTNAQNEIKSIDG